MNNMSNDFIDINHLSFTTFLCVKMEVQETLNNFCTLYLDYYKGTNQENLESLRLLIMKFFQESDVNSIFLTVSNTNLKINVFETNINFTKITDDLNAFIKSFKNFLFE